MESLIPVTLASILTTLSSSNGVIEEAVIKTHVSPEIAGLWELELESTPDFAEQLSSSVDMSELDEEESAELKALIQSIRESGELEKLQRVELVESQGQQDNQSPEQAQLQENASNNTAANYKAANCRERYNFGADNKVLTTSGEEWTYGQYIYQHQAEGLPVIAINTTYDNNKTDCSGMKVDQTGDSILAFVDYQPEKNQMRWCIDQEGRNCFMTFNRLLP